LRALREAAGLSGAQLATELGPGWRQSKVSKIETGRQLPSVSDLQAWARATGADAGQLVSLRAKASSAYRPWKERLADAGGAVAMQDELASLAASCSYLAEYQSVVVPGYLQTPAYMREMALGDPSVMDDMSSADLDRAIAARVRRQAILYEPGREIVHVMSEAVLRTRYGAITPSTMRAQLLHLAEMAALPRHTLGVLPFAVQFPVAAGEFVVYDQDLVVVESAAGELQVTEPDAVARYSRWFDLLLGASLTGAAAADFCRRLAAELGDG
jgi:transcriptional regulator with XRE-family HTH domain